MKPEEDTKLREAAKMANNQAKVQKGSQGAKTAFDGPVPHAGSHSSGSNTEWEQGWRGDARSGWGLPPPGRFIKSPRGSPGSGT